MNSDIILYINPVTVNSIKVKLLCQALAIQPEYRQIELHQGQQRTDAFLQLNPDGKVPVLIDGDLILNESNAILQYLANKYDSPLWPQHPEDQAEVLKWLFWQNNDWNPALGPLAHRRVVLPYWGFNPRQHLTPEEDERLQRTLARLDQALSNKQVLAGQDITLADISLGSYLIFAEEAQIPLTTYNNIGRWLDHLQNQPWWQQVQQQLKAKL